MGRPSHQEPRLGALNAGHKTLTTSYSSSSAASGASGTYSLSSQRMPRRPLSNIGDEYEKLLLYLTCKGI